MRKHLVSPTYHKGRTNIYAHRFCTEKTPDVPPLRGLSFLDRFLVVWIILAMALGIVLGNTISSVGPALQKGEFIGVSIPIGKFPPIFLNEDPHVHVSQ
jgi:hypothetical protein